jgi:hypothetical protein
MSFFTRLRNVLSKIVHKAKGAKDDSTHRADCTQAISLDPINAKVDAKPDGWATIHHGKVYSDKGDCGLQKEGCAQADSLDHNNVMEDANRGRVLYALKGVSNCGKTTTLRLVFKMLKDMYVVSEKEQIKYHPNFVENGNKDIQDIAVTMSDINGKRIGIMSEGDADKYLKDAIRYFVSVNCDVIFCACRTKGGTVECIEELAIKLGLYYEFVPQNVVDGGRPAESDEEMARYLIKKAGL